MDGGLFLNSASSLEVIMSSIPASNDPEVIVYYRDVPAKAAIEELSYVRGDAKITKLVAADTYTICDAPTTVGTVREVTGIYINNRSTDTEIVVVQHNNGSTTARLIRQTLVTLTSLTWTPDSGFAVVGP